MNTSIPMNQSTLSTRCIRLFATLAILFTAASLSAQTQITWNGSGTNSGNTNWSFSANWTGGTPGTTTTLQFTNPGVAGTVSNINNIVDANNTVLGVQYANIVGYHTTLINPGYTLTVSNSANTNLFMVGTLADNGVSQLVNATITGSGGTLTVIATNSGSQMEIQQGSTTAGPRATLDLSGLANFNLTVARLGVAGNPATAITASNYLSGILYLARTNVIRLSGSATSSINVIPGLNVADSLSNPGNPSTLYLGQTNSLYADTITIGRAKSTGTIKFNTGLTSPALYLRGNSATRVNTLILGDNADQGGTSGSATGTLDLSAGTVDAQVGTCIVARSQLSATSTGNSFGTLTLGAGTFGVNYLNAAIISTNNNANSATATINVTGTAVVNVNNALSLGINPNTNFANTLCFSKASLNITNGTVYASSINFTSALPTGVVGTININAGQLSVTNTVGSPALPLAGLNLTAAAIHLVGNSGLTNIVTTNITVSGTSTITLDSIGYPGGSVTYPLISYLTGSDPYSGLALALPAGYTGTQIDNSANKRIDLQITAGTITPVLGSIVWGGGVSGNWDGTTLNWTNGATTTLYADTDTVTLNDSAQTGTVSLVTNIAPGSVTFTNNTLNYTLSGPGAIGGPGGLTKAGTATLTLATTNSYAGTTAINCGTVNATAPGAIPSTTILSFNGSNGVTSSVLNLGGYAQTVAGILFTNIGTNTVTITNGTLTASPAAISFSPLGTSNALTANLSGLSAFTYNNSAGTFTVANGTVPANIIIGQSTLNLAKTNTITAGTLNLGTSSDSGGIINSTINLGTVNTLNLGSIGLGSGRADGTLQFAPGTVGGTVSLAGAAGGTSAANLTFNGHDSFQVSDHVTDVVDFTGGTVSGQLGNVTVGIAVPQSSITSNRGITVTDSLKLGAGNLTITNLTLAQINSATSDAGTFFYSDSVTAVFSLTNGAIANVTTLTIASNNYTGNLATNNVLSGTVIITNGSTLNAANILEGPLAAPALGSLAVTAQLLWGDGTLGNLAGGNLTVNGINISLVGAANNHSINIATGHTGAINSWIAGTGTITDNGAGAVTLAGVNAFTGALVMNSTNTLTLSRTNTPSLGTLVNSGTLLLGATGGLNGPTINVASNATFDVSAVSAGYTLNSGQILLGNGSVNGSVNVAAGAQILPGGAANAGTLTFSNNVTFNGGQAVTLDLSGNPASGNDLINVGGSVTLNANTTIAINRLGGSLGIGTYTLMTYASLNTNSYVLNLVAPRGTTLNYGPTALTLTVSSGASANLTWVGDGVLNNWDIQGTTNWLNSGVLDYFYELDNVTFDNTGSAAPAVNLTTTLSPGSVTVNGSQSYTFAGPGQFAGTMALTNNSSGTLTLTTSNTYTGGTVITAGNVVLVYSNAIAGQPDFAAGTGPILDNSILTFTNGGGGPLNTIVTNTISGSGAIDLPNNQEIRFGTAGTLAGFTGTFNIPAGTTTTAKGDFTAAGTNATASAIVNIANGGTVWVATGNLPATINVSGPGNAENLGAIRVDTGATISGAINLQGNTTVGLNNSPVNGTLSGPISDGGSGYSLTKIGSNSGILILANTNNNWSGGTTVSNGTLQVGTAVAYGKLPGDAFLATNTAILDFVVPTNGVLTYNGAVSGNGELEENGTGGTLILNGINTFTNNLVINAGSLWVNSTNALGASPKTVNLSNGTAGNPSIHLNGTNGPIIINSGFTFLVSWISGAIFNEAGTNEIDGNIQLTSGGGGSAIVANAGLLTLAGGIAPIVTARNLVLGGAANGLVTGSITDNGTNYLVNVSKTGTGTWTLANNNSYITNTTVSGGTLLITGSLNGGGSVTVQTNSVLGGSGYITGLVNVTANGIIQGGDVNYANTLSIYNTLTLGTTNNSITASRFQIASGGQLNASTLNVNGTNIVNIIDSSLVLGTNTLITYGGGSIGGSSGFAGLQLGTLPTGVTANLMDTGSAIQLAVTAVSTVNTTPTNIVASVTGNVLTLSWPADHTGWRLLVQTANLTNGISANTNDWSTVSGSTLVDTTNITINPALPTEFYRLVYP